MYVGVCVLQCSGCPDGIQITDPAVSQEGHNMGVSENRGP